jgi:hypothetical protein
MLSPDAAAAFARIANLPGPAHDIMQRMLKGQRQRMPIDYGIDLDGMSNGKPIRGDEGQHAMPGLEQFAPAPLANPPPAREPPE